MPGYSDPGFDTLALHAGAAPDPATGARAVPIHLTTSFVFESSDHAARCSTWSARATSTAASATPPTRCWSSAWRRLKAASAPSPPPAARPRCTWPLATLMGAGGHIVASTALYGGSQNLLHYTLRRFGIETTFVKPGDIDGWRAAVRPNTGCCLAKPWATRAWTCSTSPPWRNRARGGRAAAGGFHPHHALADQALRPRRRPGLPLGHQVPVGPRHGDRRRGGRWRQLRLGRPRARPASSPS
jgi:hypothetical protein